MTYISTCGFCKFHHITPQKKKKCLDVEQNDKVAVVERGPVTPSAKVKFYEEIILLVHTSYSYDTKYESTRMVSEKIPGTQSTARISIIYCCFSVSDTTDCWLLKYTHHTKQPTTLKK